MTNDEAFAAIRMVTKEEPLKMRPARAALKTLAANGWRTDLVADAVEALDGLTAAKRNADGYEGSALTWEKERAEMYAYDTLESIDAVIDHGNGIHAASPRSYCPDC